MNDATGVCRTRTSTLRADNTCWCATPTQASVMSVAARVAAGAVIGVGVGVPCDPVARAFQWRAVWLDADHPDPQLVRLNGLPPGEPVIGTLTAPVGGSENLSVTVSYPAGYDPTGIYEIVLEADTDGDGFLDLVNATVVHPLSNPDLSTVGPPVGAPPAPMVIRVNPNPFVGRTTIGFTLADPTTVELGVYDLTGRLIRRIVRGRLEPGNHQFDWDGKNDASGKAASGVYFVRLQAGARRVEGKLVFVE